MKSRCTRSGGRAEAGSALVVMTDGPSVPGRTGSAQRRRQIDTQQLWSGPGMEQEELAAGPLNRAAALMEVRVDSAF